MKKQYIGSVLSLLFLLIGMVACNDDDEGLMVQPHDENVMMNIMHSMMDEMHQMPPTNDPDHDFAMMMVMHHQGAITMAEEELATGDDSIMRDFAERVIEIQQAEIATMNTFMDSHTVGETISEEFTMEAMMSMERMMKSKDLRVLTGDIDQDFASLMIDHHQSAIENAKAELEYGAHEAMKVLAEQIIEDQRMEIDELQDWLLENKSY